MTCRETSYAEEAEERYEAIHGLIDYWSYGVQSARVPGEPIGPLAHHESHGVRSREAALDGLDKLAGNAVGGDEAAWEAFADQVEAQRGRKLDRLDPESTLDFELVGPDGLLYWIEEIDRN